MKKLLYLLICLTCFTSFSQEMVKSVGLNVSKNAQVFQIVEENKKQVSLFFSAKINMISIRFDEKFNVIDSLTIQKPSKDYDDIVGYSCSPENQYYVYWSNSNGKELLSQCFDYNAKKVSVKQISVPLEKEKIIKRITVNNVFYMISILKGTGILNFYVVKDGNLEKKSIDLSSKRFLAKDDKVTTLWDIVSSSTTYEPAYFFQTISNESPPSLALSANKRKIYVRENKLIFTLDNNRRFSQMFTIDLSDFSATTTMLQQKYFPQDNTLESCDSNSFLLNDKLIQIKSNSDYMKVAVKNMEGDEEKSFLINSQEITIKNSDIYQENGDVKSLRVLDKSSQLVRKISGLNPSISLYEANQNIYMVIGGVSNIQQNGAVMYGGMFGVAGVLIGAAISSNYSLNNLNSYKNRKVVYINCLFDKDFNHVNGEVKKTAFDELRAFSESNENLIAPVLFKMNSSLYYGGFDAKSGNYSFYKFND